MIDGVPASSIASKFGTPLYVYSENAIIDKLREYATAAARSCPDGVIAYASKAYLTMRMADLVAREGLWLDVASGGELYIALQAGFPAERILMHGNNKSLDELKLAVRAGVGRIVVDNMYELSALQDVAKSEGRVQDILIRLSPGVDPHTHRFLSTGKIGSKFGIPMDGNAHFDAAMAAWKAPNLNLLGFHCHIGSQIFDNAPFKREAEIMMNFLLDLRDRAGIEAKELDLGGGLGVVYTGGGGTIQISPEAHVSAAAGTVRTIAERAHFPMPRLFFEPGRSIVAAAGVTLYTVGSVKTLPDGMTVAAVDGGMSDNPRPMLYGAKYKVVPVLPPDRGQLQPVRIVGKHCEEGDTLIDEAYLPHVHPGMLLAVLVSGAYQYSMRSNYNGALNPAVVHVAGGRAFSVVQRETYKDLVARERPVPVRILKQIDQRKAANAN